MKLNIYEFPDYTSALSKLLSARWVNNRQTDLAHALGVQRTYLSRVFAGLAHLNQDQLYNAKDFFSLEDDEFEYLSLLLEQARSGHHERKKQLKRRIESIRDKNTQIKKVIDAPSAPQAKNQSSDYYLDYQLQVLHHLLFVKELRNRPERVAKILGISLAQLEQNIEKLERDGFVQKKKSGVVPQKGHFHLGLEQNSLLRAHQLLVRHASSSQMHRLNRSDFTCFSTTVSADQDTYEKIKGHFRSFLESSEKDVIAAQSKSVYQINFDFFPWYSAATDN